MQCAAKICESGILVIVVLELLANACQAMEANNSCGKISYREPAYFGSLVHVRFEPIEASNSSNVTWFIEHPKSWTEYNGSTMTFENAEGSPLFILPLTSHLSGPGEFGVYAWYSGTSDFKCKSIPIPVRFNDNVRLVLNCATSNITLKSGDSLLVNCTIVGSPESIVEWRFSDSIPQVVGYSCGPVSSCLSLDNVTNNSTGNFTCFARNGDDEINNRTIYIYVGEGYNTVHMEEPPVQPEVLVVAVGVPAAALLLLIGCLIFTAVRKRRAKHSKTDRSRELYQSTEDGSFSCHQLVPMHSATPSNNDVSVNISAHLVRMGQRYTIFIEDCKITSIQSGYNQPSGSTQWPILQF